MTAARHWIVITSLVALTYAGAGQALIGAQASARTANPAAVCQSIVVPSYMHPRPAGSAWDTLIADPPHATQVNRILIVNPASGPGRSANTDFREVVAKLHHTGQKVYGYVPTGYGKVPMPAVQKQVQAYVNWYGVDGIFVDEVSAEAKLVQPYYQPLATYITSAIHNGGVILNNGTYPDADYADIKVPNGSRLQLVIFEHDFGAFTAPHFKVPSWIRKYPANLFIDIVYDVKKKQLPTVLRLSAKRNVGAVYVTDQTLPNPYAALPSYWAELDQGTQAGCTQ